MNTELKNFPQFSGGLLLGLFKAGITDIDVFLMFLSAALLGGSSRRSRAVGKVLLLYVVARRGDQYITVMASKLDRFAAVMTADRTVIQRVT